MTTTATLFPTSMDLLDRAKGCLVGLAVGDALGAQVEFRARDTFDPVVGLEGGGPFKLMAGQWTDDTIMALCLAESLVTQGGHDPLHQLELYTRWFRDGYLSPKGYCFDIGGATSRALSGHERDGLPYRTSSGNDAGNGSLMRIAPVGICFRRHIGEAMRYAALSSRTTHAHREATSACAYMTALIILALRGRHKDVLLAPYAHLELDTKLAPDTDAVARGSWRSKERRAINSGGYAVHSLEAALWCFARTSSYAECVLLAANLGNDADTTAAIAGMLAGAYYGHEAIPADWRARLWRHDYIANYAAALAGL